MEAHSFGADYWDDRTKQALRMETDRPQVLRQTVRCCRKGGTLSVIGVHGGFIDKFPMGAFMNKVLTMRSGQMYGQKYAPKLLEYIAKGDVDPSFMITHRLPLEEIPRGFQMFKQKQDGCIRPVFVM